MTLAELQERWQELRDRTLGRGGMTRVVSADLAIAIEQDYAAYRQWYESVIGSPLAALWRSSEAAQHLDTLRALTARAQGEGVEIEVPKSIAEVLEEIAEEIPKKAASFARSAALALGVGAGVALGFFFLRGKNRG